MNAKPVAHQVYLIQSLDNGGVYVGYSADVRKRFKGHRGTHKPHPLYSSFKAHGIDRHTFSVIETYPTASEALEAEVWWIAYLRSLGARVFNLTSGGEHPVHTSESRAKIGAARRGIPLTPEHRAKVGRKGRTVSAETRAKLSLANKGKVKAPITPRERARLLALSTGRAVSEETRAKMRAAMIGRKLTPEQIAKSPRNKGRSLTPEQRTKRSEALKRYFAFKRAA